MLRENPALKRRFVETKCQTVKHFQLTSHSGAKHESWNGIFWEQGRIMSKKSESMGRIDDMLWTK